MPDSQCRRCGRPVLPIAENCPHCDIDNPCDPFLNRTVRGNIKIESVIGSGGMGTVYKGFEAHLQRFVAVKVLNTMAGTSQRSVSYFMQEARLLSKLRHPNLVSVIDFGQENDGTLLMVMEYIPGRPLEAMITEESPLEFARVVRILIQILSALEEVHRHQIVHRDLKPGNIVLENVAGSTDFVKVLDFGIAKILQSNTFSSIDGGLTAAGTAVGTPQYMSPEQAQGLVLDGRSDIYAAGILLFEMMTGHLPYESDNIVGMLVRRLAEDAPLPSTLREEIPPELDEICRVAMSRDPDGRYATVAEFRDELQELLPELSGAYRSSPGRLSHSSSTGNRLQAAREVTILAIDLALVEGDQQYIKTIHTFIARFAEASGGFYKPEQEDTAFVLLEHRDSAQGWVLASETAIQLRIAIIHRFNGALIKFGVSQGTTYGSEGNDPTHSTDSPIGPATVEAMEQAYRAEGHQIIAPDHAFDILQDHFRLEGIGSDISIRDFKSKHTTNNLESRTLSKLPLSGLALEDKLGPVGRRTPRRRIDHAIKRLLKSNTGTPLLLVGPHGTGKSHMVSYARLLAQSTGLEVLEANASSDLTDRPFRPILDLFLQHLIQSEQVDRGASMMSNPEALRQGLIQKGLEPSEARLFIDQYIAGTPEDPWTLLAGGGDAPMAYAQICRALHIYTPKERRQILTSVLRQLLKLMTRDKPLIIIVEDLDTADPGTVSCLVALAGITLETPILLLASSTRDNIEGLEVFNQIHLDLLDQKTSLDFWDELEALQPKQCGLLDVKTACTNAKGNPMYMIRWAVDPITEVPPPDGVLALLVEQFSRLPGRIRRMLLIASIMGHYFEPRVLEGLFPKSSSLTATLQDSAEQGLLEPYPPDRRWWRFRNPLIHQAVYRSVSRSDRTRYHKNIFASLCKTSNQLSQRKLLLETIQACKGVRGTEAATRTEILGDRFAIAGDLEGALDWYHLALEFFDELRLTDEERINYVRLGELGLKALEIATRLKRYDDIEEILGRFETQNEDQKIRLATLTTKRMINQGKHVDAVELIEKTLRTFRSTDSPLLAGLMVLQAQIVARAQQRTKALKILRKTSKLLDKHQEHLPEDLTHYPWLVSLLCGELILAEGREEEAEQFMEIGFQRARLVDDVNGALRALRFLAQQQLRHGEPERLTQLCYEVLQASKLSLRPTHMVVIHQLLGRGFRAMGDEAQARTYFHKALEIARELGWSSAAKQNLKLLSSNDLSIITKANVDEALGNG